MAEIVLERLHKGFAGATAVEAMDLRIADGELVVFVGPSGCGKSTTLRLIAGLEPPTSGRILFGNRDVTGLEPKDRNVAMVFQNYALYPHKSVFDNLAFGLRMRRTDKAETRRRVLWAAEMLGIEHFLERKPRQLSGGQMQRVALGRALVREPDVFLLDEPLSNLDAKLRVKMRDEIARLHRKLRRSMVYVTHDQVEAMTLGDRVVVMRDGRVQQVGTPLEIYDHPANLFVAGFIGAPEINLLRGECDRIDGEVVFESGQLRIALPPEATAIVDAGQKVTLGIRPEHVQAGSEGAAGIPAEVVLVEQMGASTLAIYDTGETELRVLSPRDDTVRPGLRRRLVIEPGRGHVFDQQSGEILPRSNRETTTATMPGGGNHDQEDPKRQAR